MQIKVNEVVVETVRKGKGSYEIANVSYSFKGEPRTQKIFSFANPQVFADVQKVENGETIEVTLAKDDKGYTNWSKISRGGAEQASNNSAPTAAPQAQGKVLGSNYETKEERAVRQVYIVKQSSLERAIQYLGGATTGATKEEILETAQQFTDWVLDSQAPVLGD